MQHWGLGQKVVDFNAGRTQLVSFDQPNNTGVTDVKMDGPDLGEKSPFKFAILPCMEYCCHVWYLELLLGTVS